jgi:hypothetical protein
VKNLFQSSDEAMEEDGSNSSDSDDDVDVRKSRQPQSVVHIKQVMTGSPEFRLKLVLLHLSVIYGFRKKPFQPSLVFRDTLAYYGNHKLCP